MSDKIKVIKSFIYGRLDNHPEHDFGKIVNKSYDDDMKELVSMARTLNADRHEITVRFSGDTRRGLQARAESTDAAMAERINKFFAAKLKENDDF